jgi:RHS repeat-associated protein
MHRLIAIVATLLLSASALAHAPRERIGALPFEPARIETASPAIEDRTPTPSNAEAASAQPHALENPRDPKTAHPARARLIELERPHASALTHCLVLENWLFGWKCASGTTVDAWGVVIDQSGEQSKLGHTGYQREVDDSYQAIARWYRPGLGRFQSMDPIDGDPMMPATLNEYLAFNGNPTVYVDPDGRYAEAGHYYTTLLAAKAAGYKDEQALRIALYAQLPDEIGKYDAVAQATGSMLMSRNRESRVYPGDPSRGVPDRRLSVKSDFNTPDQFSFQHNLAGLSADQALSKSRSAMAGARSIEGIGLAAHLMGDSFSHRTLKDESKMYEFPAGHAGDLTLPDVIAFRPELYREYVGTLVNSLAEKRGEPMSAEQTEAFVSSMMAMVEGPAAEARAREGEMVAEDVWRLHSRMELPGTYGNMDREKIYRSADAKILAALKAKAEKTVTLRIAEAGDGSVVLVPEKANLSHWANLHDGPDQEQLAKFWKDAADPKLKLPESIYKNALSIDQVDEHVREYLKDAKRGERP